MSGGEQVLAQVADSVLRKLLADAAPAAGPEPDTASLDAWGYRTQWDHLAELGWPFVGIDEEVGGSGGSVVDLVTLVTAVGRHGVPLPLGEASLGAWVLTGSGPPRSGLDLVAVCSAIPGGEVASDGQAAHAHAEPLAAAPGWRCSITDGVVTARLARVPWARFARYLTVYVHDARAPVVVDLRAEGVAIHRDANLAGEPSDQVVLTDAAAVPLQDAPDRAEVLARRALLRSAAMVGAARGALELTREHVRMREQFGKPLIELPSVAGRLAGMSVRLAAAEAVVERAGELHARGMHPSGLLAASAAARVAAGECGTHIAASAHQLHGAVGMTREYGLQRLTRQVWAWRDEFGSEHAWAAGLGRAAGRGGEEGVWDELTAASWPS